MSTLLEAHDLFFEYRLSTKGVHDVAFCAEEGDLIAVVGRNGSGKTTLLNMISGMAQPTGGQLRCAPELGYHDFGVCTQKQSIDWYLNVFDNVMLGALLAGLRTKEARLATERALKLLELDRLSDSSPEALSGGQQQRLQVARALVHEPRVLILDEPTTGLDYGYATGLFEHLKQRDAAPRSAVLVSSHDLDILEDYCNKIIYLEEGHMSYFGRMGEFLASHQAPDGPTRNGSERVGLKDIMIQEARNS